MFLPTLLLVLLAADVHEQNYGRLVREYDDAQAVFRKAFDAAATPEEQQNIIQTKLPNTAAFAVRFMALAREGAKSPAAVEALIWVVLHPVELKLKESALRAEALGTLGRDYGKDARLGSLCTRLVANIDEDSEYFMREMTKQAVERPVQARAVASLAHHLRFRAGFVLRLKEDKGAVAEYERILGKPFVAAMLKREPAKLEAEAKTLFEDVQKRFGDLPHPIHGTLGKFADAHIAAIEKPIGTDQPAPEITGTTLDGKVMKLSDYRGKVLLIDFWADSFGPSRDHFAESKKRLETLKAKPFAMLGVNADGDRKAALQASQKAGLTWPSWFDGGTGGPIATRWDVDQWPSVVLIDAKGVIRHLWAGWPEEKELDKAIADLLAKAEK